jgi:hypothetical protein
MTSLFLTHKKATSLEDQIRDTERHRELHQRKLHLQADKLAQDIQQEITDPGSLLLACGIGFIMGEITKRQAPKTAGKRETSPLKTAMTLMNSAQTLYAALPLTWLIKSLTEPEASSRKPNTPNQHKRRKTDFVPARRKTDFVPARS